MARLVIDASVAVAWCLRDEEKAAEADTVVSRLRDETGIVPGLFWHEMRNVLVRAESKGRIDVLSAERHLSRLRDLLLITDNDQDDETTIDLARRHNLTAYDAAYLETAHRYRAHLSTFDKSLSRAVKTSP